MTYLHNKLCKQLLCAAIFQTTLYLTDFIITAFSFRFFFLIIENLATKMFFFSCDRDKNFKLRNYIIPVLSIYILPMLLYYLNLLPIPPNSLKLKKSNATNAINKVTTCRYNDLKLEDIGSTPCIGSNCGDVQKDITCPRTEDPRSDMTYCCPYSRNGKTWIECCDANTYGMLHNTTSNVFVIYMIILSVLGSIACCPCSPLFRQFRQKILKKLTSKKETGNLT